MVSNPRVSSAQRQDSPFFQQAQAAAIAADWETVVQALQQHLAVLEEGSWTSDVGELSHLCDLAIAVLYRGDFQDRWDVAKLFPQLEALLNHPTENATRATRAADLLINPLIALLQDEDEDPDSRWFAARILGEFRHTAALSALIELLKTSQAEDLHQMAAAALTGFGAIAIAAVSELLDFNETRLLAVQTLAQIRGAGIIEPLMQVLHDEDAQVRAAALAAIGSTRDPRIPEVLMAALGDSAAVVRQAAVVELGFRADMLPNVDLVSLIHPLLVDSDSGVCQQAAIALGRLGTNPAASALYGVAQQPYTARALHPHLVSALGWIDTPTAIHYLFQLADRWSSDPAMTDLLRTTIQAMGHTETPELRWQVSRHLIDLLRSDRAAIREAGIKQAIALQLGKLGHLDALEPLAELTTDPELSVKLHAIAALKHLDGAQGRQHLEALSREPRLSEQMRHEVAIALAEW